MGTIPYFERTAAPSNLELFLIQIIVLFPPFHASTSWLLCFHLPDSTRINSYLPGYLSNLNLRADAFRPSFCHPRWTFRHDDRLRYIVSIFSTINRLDHLAGVRG